MTTRISAHSAQASSVAITTPTAGDVIIVFAHRDGSTTAPTLVSGYTNIASAGANTNSARVAYKISDGTETTSGTWTNATSVAVGVYRGIDPQLMVGTWTAGGAASTTIAYTGPAFQVSDSSSWAIAFAAHRTATNVGQAPAGMTVASSATDVAISDTNGGVASWSTANVTVNANSGWRSYVIELVAKATSVSVTQLVSHTAAQTNGNFETGNAFKCPTPNATRAGNCLVLCVGYAFNASRTVTITDNQGSTWPAAAITRNNDAGDLTAAIYVLPNITSGITMLTITFDALIEGFTYNLTELWGIATTSPVDVTTSAQPNSPPLASGSMTTTQANDVVITWGTPGGWGTPYIGTNPTGFRSMPGHRLLSADRWIGFVAQIGVKATAGAVNPTIYMESPTVESFNMLAVALKTDNTKGSQATGVRVVGIHKTRMNNGTFVPRSFPTWGNLQILATSETPSQCTINAVKDSANAGAAWTRLNDAGYPQVAYLPNSAPDQTNVVYVTNTTNFLHGVLYDIADADTSPYDTTAFVGGGTVVGPANLPNAPDITPTTANGLILGVLNFFTGPPDLCDLPTGVIYDCAYHTGMTDLSTLDTGDGYSHYQNPNTSQASFRWHETAVTTTGWSTRAVAFKAPASGSVGATTGTGVANAIAGSVAGATGSASVVGIAGGGSVGAAVGSVIVAGLSGAVAKASGVGVAPALAGSVGACVAGANVVSLSASRAIATGAGTAAGLAASIGQASGGANVVAIRGALGNATGAGAASGLSGSIGAATGAGVAAGLSGTGSIGAAAGSSSVAGLSGSVGAVTGAGVASALAASVAAATGTATVVGLRGSLGTASGAGVAAGLAASVGIATGSGVAAALAGSIGQATGAGVAAGISGTGSIGTATGSASVNGLAGAIAAALGVGTASALAGSIGAAFGSAAVAGFSGTASIGSAFGSAQVVGLSGSIAGATGAGTAQGVAGSVATCIGSASVLALFGALGSASGGASVVGLSGSIGAATGAGVANGISSTPGVGVGMAVGSSNVVALSGAIARALGVGVANAIGVSVYTDAPTAFVTSRDRRDEHSTRPETANTARKRGTNTRRAA